MGVNFARIASTARWLALTALLEYVFLDRSSNLRPFIGVGVKYTSFFDRDSTAQGNAASDGTAGVIRTTHIGFGPQTLVFSVGYSF
jgi:outer membrane protein W